MTGAARRQRPRGPAARADAGPTGQPGPGKQPGAGPLGLPPLPMPDQNLCAAFRDAHAPGVQSDGRTLALRALVLLVPLCVTGSLGWLSVGWFAQDGRLSLVEIALTGTTGLAFFWVVLSAATATLGLFWRARTRAEPLHGLNVAILLPMYGEPAKETIGHAVRLLAGLSGRGRHGFALHILSDTRASLAAAQEETVVADMRQRHPCLSIAYRRRAQNIDYKSGNIRDWVQSCGRDHDAMLILDADSIMGPATVLRMADALAQEPGTGLIQTVPRVLPGQTVWQGLQSLASEVYGVNMGRGFAMWTGAEGNFMGHNALVRVGAFAASAGLPHLSGPAPRGGVILSHDFVEAALLRRAGWGVRMMPEAEDSFEDTPETLFGYLKRDRRWCQGNLQHLRLLCTPGLHPMTRFHLLQGAFGYLASVWWMALLILWAMPVGRIALPDASATGLSLPAAAALPPVGQGAIAGLVALMLMAPKIMGLVGHLRRNRLPWRGVPRFAGLVLTEAVVSALIAPALMVHQVRAVLHMLCGRDGGWMPHATGRLGLRRLLRFHAVETGLGLVLLALVLGGVVSLWLLPVVLGLCLTVPLAALVQMPRSAFRAGPNRWRTA